MTEGIWFGKEGISAIPLSDWLDYCCGNRTESSIALPLIQRGSVWKPDQIADLWDSLLRGMPIGSFMVNTLAKGTSLRLPGQGESRKLEHDAFGLLDGQQRTLAMLAGWPFRKGQPLMDRRVWVDFADEPGKEHLLRLRVTTANHPFGFRRDDPKAKLSLSDRRKAIMAWQYEHGLASATTIDFRSAKPYAAGNSLPVDLVDLIKGYTPDIALFTQSLREKIEHIKNYRATKRSEGEEQFIERIDVWQVLGLKEKQSVLDRIALLHMALSRLLTSLHVPLIKIDMDAVQSGEKSADEDPALAILFKRVGANGTSLSNADYIFSVIKHYCPETHDLVNKLYQRKPDYNQAAMLAPASLVTTAVRLAATRCLDEKGKPWSDAIELDKRQFARLLAERVAVAGEAGSFLSAAFLPLVNSDHALSVAALFGALEDILCFKERGDIGLPAQALWLLKKPLLQVLLLWAQTMSADIARMQEQRKDVISFVLFWNLCIKEADKASVEAYKHIREAGTAFRFSSLVNRLVDSALALPLFSPDALKRLIPDVIRLPIDENDERPLKGWSRFSSQSDASDATNDDIKKARELYRRWWGQRGHIHPLLLWLQRDYVSTLPGSPADGREEDTPYDYDHILPASHWSDWTGQGNNPYRIACFMPVGDDHYGVVGNSIGNIRIWSSSDNRSDGDLPPSGKLPDDARYVASAIDITHRPLWEACSAEPKKYRSWNRERAWAFQRAVEERAWSLYEGLCGAVDSHFIWT